MVWVNAVDADVSIGLNCLQATVSSWWTKLSSLSSRLSYLSSPPAFFSPLSWRSLFCHVGGDQSRGGDVCVGSGRQTARPSSCTLSLPSDSCPLYISTALALQTLTTKTRRDRSSSISSSTHTSVRRAAAARASVAGGTCWSALRPAAACCWAWRPHLTTWRGPL